MTTKAKLIVDGILGLVEQAGYFEGSGKRRKLYLNSIVRADHTIEHGYDRMVKWVEAQLQATDVEPRP